MGLAEKLEAAAGALSGGQRRKLSVALAFVGDPSGNLIVDRGGCMRWNVAGAVVQAERSAAIVGPCSWRVCGRAGGWVQLCKLSVALACVGGPPGA